jgi:hypothetical protein
MISKTVLATNPRHRPHRDLLAAGWQEVKLGQWGRAAARVALEIDGLWHSYVLPNDTMRSSPGFPTVTDAMLDADRRVVAAA